MSGRRYLKIFRLCHKKYFIGQMRPAALFSFSPPTGRKPERAFPFFPDRFFFPIRPLFGLPAENFSGR
jgi:hypothetical protein